MNQNYTSSPATASDGRTDASTDGRLIASDRVEGTGVYDAGGKHIGTIKRLMLDKVDGRIAYAVVAFGGFLGMNQDTYPLPWDKLDYDTSLGGYRTDVTQNQVQGAPSLNRDRSVTSNVRSAGAAAGLGRETGDVRTDGGLGSSDDDDYDWNDRGRETELHDYYSVGYYWEE